MNVNEWRRCLMPACLKYACQNVLHISVVSKWVAEIPLAVSLCRHANGRCAQSEWHHKQQQHAHLARSTDRRRSFALKP